MGPERPATSAAILTPERRVRVFISSTLKELSEERNAAAAAVRSLRLIPVMFELGARPHPPRDLYQSYVDQSDVFVGIYGESYGWVAPELDVSGIEDEYLTSEGKPRLVYVKEPAPGRDPRLEGMLSRIRDAGALSYRSFSSPEELEHLLADDLALLLTERFTGGVAPAARPPSPAVLNASRFVGRKSELEGLVTLLRDPAVRLVTLCGPGGVGKTRLALEAAAALEADFPDGRVIVWLDAISDPSLVLEAIAAELGVRNRPGKTLVSLIGDRLSGARMLVVVDNFEHVVAAARDMAALALLPTATKFLVTSREVLQLRGEQSVVLDPLPLPDAGEADPRALLESEAVAFFVDRARTVSPGFELDESQAPVVREIVRRLDGLPLALELAAARVRVLPPRALLDRLGKGLDVPGSTLRDLPARQRTIRETITWSYDLLDEREQVALEWLSVFAASASLEAAEALVTEAVDDAGVDVVDVLMSLVDKSLVRAVDRDGELRFRTLVAVREYARERLEARGGTVVARDAHARYFRAFASRTAPCIHSPDQVRVLAQFEREHENLQAALDWLLSRDQAEDGLDLCNHLRWFWSLRGHLTLGVHWTERFLASASGSPAHGAGLVTIGMMYVDLGEWERARDAFERAIESTHARDDREELAWARTGLGAVHHALGETASAEELQELAYSYFREVGNCLGQCASNTRLGVIALAARDHDQAEKRFLVSLAARRKIKDPWGTAYVLTELGDLRLLHDDIEGAEVYLREALDLIEDVGYLEGIARVNDLLGQAAAARGAWEEARDRFRASLASSRKVGSRRGIAIGLGHLACAEVELGQVDAARRRAFEAFDVADDAGDPRSLVAALDAVAAVLAASRRPDKAREVAELADAVRREHYIPSPPVRPPRHGLFGARRRERGPAGRSSVTLAEVKRVVEAVSTEAFSGG